jgi:hypothetical protein
MRTEPEQLASKINELGNQLSILYQELKGNKDFNFSSALIYPEIFEEGGVYKVRMINIVDGWVADQQIAIYQKQAEAARKREEQWEILREQRAAERKQLERDNIQTQINLINNEVVDLRALIQRHEGWRGGNVREELAAIQRKLDDKIIEINQLKQQQEILSWML